MTRFEDATKDKDKEGDVALQQVSSDMLQLIKPNLHPATTQTLRTSRFIRVNFMKMILFTKVNASRSCLDMKTTGGMRRVVIPQTKEDQDQNHRYQP